MKKVAYVGILALGGCAVLGLGNKQPATQDSTEWNPIQQKYLTTGPAAGENTCAPKGALATIMAPPYECGMSLEECGAAKVALAGQLPPEVLELFADAIHLEAPKAGKEAQFSLMCPVPASHQIRYLEGLGIQGLGYAHDTGHLPALLELAAHMDVLSGANRELLVAALIQLGPSVKDQVVPALAASLEVEGSILQFKELALLGLARYGSPAGGEHCKQVLTAGKDPKLTQACIGYLGAARVPGSVELLGRTMDKEPRLSARALGQLGDPAGVALLEAYLDKLGSADDAASVVALINLGQDKKYLPVLELMIAGRRPLSLKEQQRKADELAKAKDRGKVQKRWEDDEARLHGEVAERAVAEAAYLTGDVRVDGALQATSKSEAKELWKAAILATAVLAQRGDAAAVTALGQLIGNPGEKVRDVAIAAAGGHYFTPAGAIYYGRGVVPDQALVAPLMAYLDSEPSAEKRAHALHAIAAIRSFAP